MDIRKRLLSETMLFDGAMGTILADTAGMPRPPAVYEELNLTKPALVQSVHKAFLGAGAEIIETNTFRGNRPALEAAGVTASVAEVNRHGVEIARAAIVSIASEIPRYIAGSIGPIFPDKTHNNLSVPDLYYEQAGALLEAGVDCLLLETLTTPQQAQEGLIGIRKAVDAVGSNVPVLISFAPVDSVLRLTPTHWHDLISSFSDKGADFFGFNCGEGPAAIRAVLEQIGVKSDKRLLIMPSAGLPRRSAGSMLYPIGPEEFAAELRAILESFPVCAAGGCCGTTPAHTRALRQVLDSGLPRSFPV